MSKRILCTAIVIILIVFSGCAAKDDSLVPKVDQYIDLFNKTTTGGQMHGHILVAKDGEVLINKSYGKADYERNIGITEDTIFLIGSVTKPITAIGIMQLQEAGLLDISDPVSKYIPQQTRGDDITISQLLSHTAGLLRDPRVSLYQPISREELVSAIAEAPLIHDPGTQYSYSNAGYNLLAWIIEVVSGQIYEEYLQTNIFSPLGMSSTGAVACNDDLPDNAATGHYVSNSQIRKELASIFELSVFWGAGNVYSTAADLYLMDRALYTGELLALETVDAMMEKGLGWGILDFNGHRGAGHNGLLYNGYSATFQRYPHEDLVIIILMNVSNRDNVGLNIGQVLTTMVLGEDYTLPAVQKQIKLDKADLNKFCGEYQLAGSPVTIRVSGNYLVLDPVGHEFLPSAETDFFAVGSEYRRITFSLDDDGNVYGFKYQECVVEFDAVRIN